MGVPMSVTRAPVLIVVKDERSVWQLRDVLSCGPAWAMQVSAGSCSLSASHFRLTLSLLYCRGSSNGLLITILNGTAPPTSRLSLA